MKDIVIVANFIGALDGGKNSRFTYLADKLNKIHGMSVEIVSSSFSHDYKKQRDNIPNIFEYKVTLIEEPGYKKNVCIRRFYSHYVWGKNVVKYLESREKPDLIYCAVPSLTGPDKVGEYCKNNKIPFIIDIQDLWPEAFQMVFDVPILNKIVFAPFKKIANRVYKKADEVIAVSQTYVDRALKNNNKAKGLSVFLGTDLSAFDENAKISIVVDSKSEYRKQGVIVYDMAPKTLEKRSDEIWIAYCGTLGSSYDISTAIKAISKYNKSNKNVKFIVMGRGPKQQEFIDCAKNEGISAIFTGDLVYSNMCSVLVHCDININPISAGAAQSIINKHADYAASGLPVINTQESPEYRKLVEDYNMGFNCRNSDVEDLFEKIELLVMDSKERKEKGKNARKCAEEKFDRSRTYDQIVNVILSCM